MKVDSRDRMAEKIDIISNQKGASIIAVIAIMLILAVMGAALVSLVTTGSDISINQLQSEQAFNIAEGGIEKALTEFVKNNTPCASLVYTNSLGAGSFTTAPTLHTMNVLLDANITAADTVIPVNSTAGYASHGRIRIENEDINYAATSTTCAPFASPACFTGAQRGVAGSTAVLHNAGAGVNTAQEECLVRSTGTVTNSSAQRIVEKGIQMPGAMMVYAKANIDGNVYYRRWDGTNWGPERNATAVPSTIRYLVLKFSRTRNEAILGTLSSTGAINVQVWNGNTQTWGAPLLLFTVGGGDSLYRGFDIEYETTSDRAIVVYNDGDGNPSYRIWNGTPPWSAAADIPIAGARPIWIELAPNPQNDEIAMITLKNNTDVYARYWTGAAWNDMGAPGAWDTTTAVNDTNVPNMNDFPKIIDVAYEQTSGRAMFIWGDDDRGGGNQRLPYRIWDSATVTLDPVRTDLVIGTMADVANWIRLVPNPTPGSNQLMVGVQDNGRDLNTRLWNGIAWDTVAQHPEHDGTTEDTDSRNFDIVFETHPANAGKAWLVWGNAANVSRKQWDSATNSWGAPTTVGDDTALVQLLALPQSRTVLTAVYEDSAAGSDDIREMHLTGGSAAWSTLSSPSTTPSDPVWAGPTVPDPVLERVFIASERYVPIINWREIYP
ncbi:MAG: hypothetical protein Q8P28_05710 [Deltaproteobacteria bacterium]|nr:hypothetical protein [Deltaproteobacteria bacterium]